jgi:hypothetical protein
VKPLDLNNIPRQPTLSGGGPARLTVIAKVYEIVFRKLGVYDVEVLNDYILREKMTYGKFSSACGQNGSLTLSILECKNLPAQKLEEV